MSTSNSSFRKVASKELALLLTLVLFGLVLLPICVFFVGDLVFGDYGRSGFSGFFNTLSSKIREGNGVAWFLVLSPYLAWQTIRLTAYAWRALGATSGNESPVGKR